MKFRYFDKKHGIIFILAIFFIILSQNLFDTKNYSGNVILTEQAKEHILYGDSKGGGHMYGANIPCKS